MKLGTRSHKCVYVTPPHCRRRLRHDRVENELIAVRIELDPLKVCNPNGYYFKLEAERCAYQGTSHSRNSIGFHARVDIELSVFWEEGLL